MRSKLCVIIIFLTATQLSYGQSSRLNHKNFIGWYNYFGTFKLSRKLGLHTEYQWRRDNIIKDWQQSLLRIGLNYNVNPRVLLRAGYGWIETFPYGEFPLNGLGRDFTEHRIFEMVHFNYKEGAIDFSHRFMLEQRFVGRYNAATESKEDEFPLLHRARYMVRLQTPLIGKEIKANIPYAAIYNEIFIGFGKNVNANIFDQNRIGILLGYQFTKNVRLEGGYLNQTLQFGRQIAGRNVFQTNSGVILNANFNFDLTKNTKN